MRMLREQGRVYHKLEVAWLVSAISRHYLEGERKRRSRSQSAGVSGSELHEVIIGWGWEV